MTERAQTPCRSRGIHVTGNILYGDVDLFGALRSNTDRLNAAVESNASPEEFSDARNATEAHGLASEHVLGRGGVGVVFSARRDGKTWAVKVAQPWPGTDDSFNPTSTLQRLRTPLFGPDGRSVRWIPPSELSLCNRILNREHQRLSSADDESVVKPIEVFTEQGRMGYVMPVVEGPALELKPGPPLAALARTLQRLHEKQWPHGDLKPQNVRVISDDQVCLIDPLPMPIGTELITPEWTHLNFLVSTPLVDSADPRDRRMVFRYRDLIALALMGAQAFTGERPWGHAEVTRMMDRSVPMEAKREELSLARERLRRLLAKVPSVLRPFLALALEPGLWPEEGPTFAAYLQARPFETRCDALVGFDLGRIFAEATK